MPRLPSIASATSLSASSTSWPSPVMRRWRSAASTAMAAAWPVMQSHAGRTWATGLAGALRAGGVREAHGRVDRVVDRRAAGARAQDRDHDQVVAAALEGRIVQLALAAQVGEEHPGVGAGGADQGGGELAAARAAEIERDRAFALVHPGPEQAVAFLGHRPAMMVEPALDPVEADHVGPQLRQGHPGEGSRHERRALDHAQAMEQLDHVSRLPSARRPAWSWPRPRWRRTDRARPRRPADREARAARSGTAAARHES